MSTRLHSDPPFRVEHVGSLLRPKELLEKRAQLQAQQCTPEELKAAEDAAIVEVVKFQRENGLKTITDGEYRRAYYFEGMFEKLDGMEFVMNRPIEQFKSYLPYYGFYLAMKMSHVPSIFTSGKIKRTKGIHTEEFKYLASVVKPEEVKYCKITMCSPIWLHLRHGSENTYDHSVYKNDDEYFADLVQAYREEIDELYTLGCRHVQFDDPAFCFFCATSMLDGMKAVGVDHEAVLSRYIEVYNTITRGRPDDLVISVHMCRGNYKGHHYSEGGYEPVAKKLFTDLDVDCLYMEYDTERAGDFQPLRYLPPTKRVVLGLVTTKKGELESASEVQARVAEAVNIIADGYPKRSREDALKQVSVSPQCGFASVAEGNPITAEDQEAKVRLLGRVAEVVWSGVA